MRNALTTLILASTASLTIIANAYATAPAPCVHVSAKTAPATMADVKRSAFYAVLSKDWTDDRRVAFARLRGAEETFAAAVGTNETDRDELATELASREAEHAAFLHMLLAVVQGKTRIAFVEFATSDSALNAAYAQVMAVNDPSALSWGSVDKPGIRQTQRAWLAYRDAFVAFAATFDADTADAVKAELTTRRTVSLEAFLED